MVAKGTWDLRLFTVSYRREGPEELPVIQLFGRTSEGRSMVAEYWGFEPYFYCIEPSPELQASLERDPEVRRIEPVELEVGGVKRRCLRVVEKHPWRTPEMRQRCRSKGSDVLAADIPFGQRFMFDLDLGACVRVHGEQTEGNYTTDLVVRAERFENIEAFSPPLKVISFDVEQSLRDGRLLVVGLTWRKDGKIQREALRGDEKQIIQKFVEFIAEEDPDVISGYNIDGFDIPAMIERAKRLGMDGLPLARDYQTPTSIGDRFWRLHGRILADVWWSAKKELRPKRETLHDVALMLGLEKSGVVGTAFVERKDKRTGAPEVEERPVFIGSNVDEWWEKDPETVVRYCENDAEVSLLILERLASLEKAMDVATVSRLPLDDVFNGRTSTLIDSILIRAADRAGVGVPMMKTRGGEMESIEGGYVHSIQPGLYEWVDVLDFRSMYPTIIIEKNICFTTLNPKGTIVSPTGVHFLSKEQRLGLLPKILQDLMRWRGETRDKMRGTKAERNEYYERLQSAIKILTNAFYGVLASSFYRFTNLEIGASITAFARENIKGVIQRLEAEERVKAIYGDSVPGWTPVMVRRHGSMVEILPIEDLHTAKAMHQAREDLEVWTEEGWKVVRYVYKHRVGKPGVRIRTRTALLEATDDHSLVVDGVEVKPSTLKVGDYVRVVPYELTGTLEVPPDLAWTFGFFAAEGTVGSYETRWGPKNHWAIVNQDSEPLERCRRALLRYGFQTKVLTCHGDDRMFKLVPFDGNGMKRRSQHRAITEFFSFLFLTGSGAKKVPHVILAASSDAQQAFLAGYLAGDGGINGGIRGSVGYQKQFRFDTVDPSLAAGLLAIIRRLGMDYGLKNRRDKDLVSVYQVQGEGVRVHPVSDEAEVVELVPTKMEGPVYDLETENHHFVAGIGGILAHNTDSIFFESPEKNLEGAVAVGKQVATKYSRGGETLQFERVLETFFSHGKKKRYAGRSVWPIQEYIFRGYEIRRTDAFDLQIRAQQAIFERILDRDVEGAIKMAKEVVQNTVQGNVPFEDLVISRTVKDEDTYVNPEAMSNVQAARKLEALGFEFTPGMKVSWIVTDGGRRPQEVEPFVYGRPFQGTPDYEYYSRRLAQSLGYVTEVFGWDEKSLLSGTTQATLFHEGFSPPGKAEARPKKTDRDLTLEDFL